jgi:hypothetical protein
MFPVQPSINHQALFTQIKYVMVLSNMNLTSTEYLQICGHVKRPPPEPPPMEKMKVLRFCVCICVVISTQQMIPSLVVSLTNFENPDSQYVHPQAKLMIRNWIELKTVVPQPTYHVCRKFAWLLGLSYWFCSIVLVSSSFKLIDIQLLDDLVIYVVLRLWMGNVLTHIFQCLYSLYLIS